MFLENSDGTDKYHEIGKSVFKKNYFYLKGREEQIEGLLSGVYPACCMARAGLFQSWELGALSRSPTQHPGRCEMTLQLLGPTVCAGNPDGVCGFWLPYGPVLPIADIWGTLSLPPTPFLSSPSCYVALPSN